MSDAYVLMLDIEIEITNGNLIVNVNRAATGTTSVYSDGTARTVREWISYILAATGGGTYYNLNYTEKEYVQIEDIGSEDITWLYSGFSNGFCESIGMYEIGFINQKVFNYSWGWSRCVLNGSENGTSGLPNSVLSDYRDENPDSEYETVASRKYIANGGFDKNDIMKTWIFESRWLDGAKRSFVLDFIHACIFNKVDSELVKIYNFPDYIITSISGTGGLGDFKLNLVKSVLPVGDRLERALFKFSIALQEVVL